MIHTEKPSTISDQSTSPSCFTLFTAWSPSPICLPQPITCCSQSFGPSLSSNRLSHADCPQTCPAEPAAPRSRGRSRISWVCRCAHPAAAAGNQRSPCICPRGLQEALPLLIHRSDTGRHGNAGVPLLLRLSERRLSGCHLTLLPQHEADQHDADYHSAHESDFNHPQ